MNANLSNAIDLIITPKEKDLGEFTVRRTLPSAKRQAVGPWIFFDHMGPAVFPAGSGVNVRPHPHINLATVTYLFDGEILHRDSLGNKQAIRPGDLNLMVAGKGITHSERERPEVNSVRHSLHGLQLWLALPEEHEETDPAFYHYPSADLPKLTVNGVPLRVMIGSAYGVTSPVKTFATTLYVEAHLQAGQTLALPTADERAVYIASGKLCIDNTPLATHSLTVLRDTPNVHITAEEESRIAILGGSPVGKRFIEWNFVSSSQARIEAAKKQWQLQQFDKVVGDEIEFIPLP